MEKTDKLLVACIRKDFFGNFILEFADKKINYIEKIIVNLDLNRIVKINLSKNLITEFPEVLY